MQGETLERWQKLCQEAAQERDHHHFLQLTRDIIRMLTEKAEQMEHLRTNTTIAKKKSA